MQLTVTCVTESRTHPYVSRYVTDEHNNLGIYAESGALVALYSYGEWKSVTAEEAS